MTDQFHEPQADDREEVAQDAHEVQNVQGDPVARGELLISTKVIGSKKNQSEKVSASASDADNGSYRPAFGEDKSHYRN